MYYGRFADDLAEILVEGIDRLTTIPESRRRTSVRSDRSGAGGPL
jgi:hypothetical protein